MKLFLDDRRVPYDVFLNTIDIDYSNNDEWYIVKSYDEFVDYISNNELPSLISFDHDLIFEHYFSENQTDINYESMVTKTGYHAAKWLLEYCKNGGLQIPSVKFHTMNTEGKKNMEELFV